MNDEQKNGLQDSPDRAAARVADRPQGVPGEAAERPQASADARPAQGRPRRPVMTDVPRADVRDVRLRDNNDVPRPEARPVHRPEGAPGTHPEGEQTRRPVSRPEGEQMRRPASRPEGEQTRRPASRPEGEQTRRPASRPEGEQMRRSGAAAAERGTPSGTRRQKKKRARTSVIIGRVLLVIFTAIFILLFSVVALCQTIVNGPSETVRDLLVLSAMQASATKWLPGIFLDDATINEILARSDNVEPEVIPMGTLNTNRPADTDVTPGTDVSDPDDTSGGSTVPEPVDEWADAIDGMIYKTYSGATFKAYMLIIKDPSRVYVGTSSDYKSGKIGSRIFDIVEREDAIAGINAGEFADTNGQGTGDTPIGLTYSKGNCVWNDGERRTFIGFDDKGVLHAVNSMTKEQADTMGIRDAVSFQTGNVLISNDGEAVSLFYAEGNVAMSQRTAIAQRADGAVILLVTDGRTASSLGATRNDIIDLLLSEGAVTAGMLDGGSSTMMYYKDYYTKYGIDTSTLDEYQLQGLTNRYKAFTKPRHMPTFFLVSPES